MKVQVNISKAFSFRKERSVRINGKIPCDYSKFPTGKGVYVFHIGSIDKVWTKKNIVYIGAANRESLRQRIKKNALAKIINSPINNPIFSKPIYVTYCVIENNAPDYLPFLVEGYLLNKYERKFNELPRANIGRR